MAPRMHIEVTGTPEAEVEAAVAPMAPTPSVAAPAPQVQRARAQAPKAKVDSPAAAVESDDESAVVSAPAISAPTAPKPAAGASKTVARESRPAARPQVKVAPMTETDRAADVEGTFEFASEADAGRAAGTVPTQEAASTGAAAEGAAPKPSLTAWVRRTFPGHVHAFWGAVVAIVVALLTFAIGLPRMLLIAILVLIGIALGQVLDGDPKIIRAIRDLFSSDRER